MRLLPDTGRRHACEIVGLDTIPMFIRDYTDDEATIIMVDSNIQREDIISSEKATVWIRLEKLPERVQKQYKDIFTLPTYRMHF